MANFPLIYIGINVSLILYLLSAYAVKFFPSHRSLGLVFLFENHCISSIARCSRCHTEWRKKKGKHTRAHIPSTHMLIKYFPFVSRDLCVSCECVCSSLFAVCANAPWWNNKKTLACDCFMIFVRVRVRVSRIENSGRMQWFSSTCAGALAESHIHTHTSTQRIRDLSWRKNNIWEAELSRRKKVAERFGTVSFRIYPKCAHHSWWSDRQTRCAFAGSGVDAKGKLSFYSTTDAFHTQFAIIH